MGIDVLIVTDALLENQDGLQCHPDFLLWQTQLSRRRRQWFSCADKNPLGWYAALTATAPAALLAGVCPSLDGDIRQLWVASPYHAQMMRDSVRVFPEAELAWTATDAARLCSILNPLLAEEGMQLLHIGAALLFTCRQPMEVYPLSFAAIAGHLLPNRHHEGEDGGRLNCLLSELQMLLFQHPSIERHDRNEPDINGIWLWGAADWPQQQAVSQLSVASRDPFLQAIVEGRDARMMISPAAQLSEMLQSESELPNTVVLAGSGSALVLKKTWLPRLGKASWQPRSVKPETALLSLLDGYHAA